MVQRQDIDAGTEAQPAGPLRSRRQKNVLRRRHAVHRGRVVLGEVIGKEPGVIERLHQLQPVFVEAKQRRAGEVLDVIEDAEPDAAHFPIALPPIGAGCPAGRGSHLMRCRVMSKERAPSVRLCQYRPLRHKVCDLTKR